MSPLKTQATLSIVAVLALGACADAELLYSTPPADDTTEPATQEPDETGQIDEPSDTGPAECEEDPTSAAAILEAYCYSCHGDNGSSSGGFAEVLDVETMIDDGKLVPGDATASLIYLYMSAGSMPPVGNPTPSSAEIAAVAEWIDCGASPFEPPAPPRVFITADDVLDAMRDDLDGTPPDNRPFIRYITFDNLYNAGLPDEDIDLARRGVTKLLLSLSREELTKGNITPPTVPMQSGVSGDPESDRLIMRMDLRRFGWDREDLDQWELILRDYPYGVEYDTSDADFLADETGTRLPYVHGDWLAGNASEPPLYHELLDLPTTSQEFLAEFGVDTELDMANGDADCAGFLESEVSDNNRIICRHDALFGYCWVSYDFAGNGEDSEFQNIFEHPIDFEEDGGEMFCSLPNGMQAYYIADAAGNQLDVAPTEIVQDPEADGGTVVNGRSCFRCHENGIIYQQDEIRDAVSANPDAYDSEDLILVNKLFPESKVFTQVQTEDTNRFTAAEDRMGFVDHGVESVSTLANWFDEPMDSERVAAELGLPEERFSELLSENNDINEPFAALQSGGMVDRELFDVHVRDLVCGLELQDCDEPPVAPCGASGIECLDGQTCIADVCVDDGGA